MMPGRLCGPALLPPTHPLPGSVDEVILKRKEGIYNGRRTI